MPLIIDTFNVLHTTGVLPPDLSGMDVEELRGVISLSRFRRQKVHLVCDGVEPAVLRHKYDDDSFDWNRGLQNIAIMWSGAHTNADSLIEILVAQDTAPRRLTVVTSDRRLGREVRKRRVRVMSSESFLERLGDDFRSNVDHACPGGEGGIDAPGSMRPAFAFDVPLNRESIRWWMAYLEIDPDQPRIDGRDIAPSEPSHIIETPDEEADVLREIHEQDPIRGWLRYFGFDPDDLPAEMLVAATAEDEAVLSPDDDDAPAASIEPDAFDETDPGDPIDIDSIDPGRFLDG